MQDTPHAPCLLALETATDTLRLGVSFRGRVFEHEGPGGAQSSATLIPALWALMARAGCTMQDVDAIAFGRGPGAFTGLRTACSVAQGLALGRHCPVLPIDTLLVVAEAARQAHGDTEVWAAQDARMNQLYAARYRWLGDRWATLDAPALYDPADFAAQLGRDDGAVVAGNAVTVHAGLLQLGGRIARAQAVPSASALLALGASAWARGEAVDAALALPLYVRDKVAQTTAEREALRTP
jgi:tRNA threonylcarbamoyladenosine biosynthesis protein TsaB